MRRCKGVAISSGADEKLFYKAGPATFGLLEWLSPEEIEALEEEESISKQELESEGDDGAKTRQQKNVERRNTRRRDPSATEKMFRSYCTTDKSLEVCVRAFADGIRAAHERNPASWNVTLRRAKLHLTVGRSLSLGLRPEGVWISVLNDALSAEAEEALAKHASGGDSEGFQSLPGSAYHFVPPVRFPDVWPSIREAALGFIHEAAARTRRTPYAAAHSPGAVEFIATYLNEDLPSPSYTRTGKASAPGDLEALFEEFVSEYAEDEEGESHLARYETQRRQAEANYGALRQRREANEDITDDVLLKLLPHNNSEGNRKRGAWISLAPAVTKDLKSWFEGAGWAKPEDWPRIADAIWNFVSRCVDEPGRLSEECEKFAELDYFKGFQSGLLSPALNALRPDVFHVVNNKSRVALNHFVGQSYSSKLSEYPSVNAALGKLIGEHGDVLSIPEQPNIPASDVFDAFSHWLIGVRKSFEVTDDGGPEEGGKMKPEPETETRELQPNYTEETFLTDTGFTQEQLKTWLRILRRKQQIVLQGPPGTGKTYVAQRLAKLLVSGTDGLLETVQFHPAYSYEDFMLGIRPRVLHGALSYEWEDGMFVRFCKEAATREGPCVLIIDEINRANLSRVFGELMYLLEYRDDKIPLAGGDDSFSIPANVLLVGTMNTADRSIARLDHALRRRFSFVRLRPDYDVLLKHLDGHGLPGSSLVETLKEVNRLIDDHNYEVGISFFMRKKPDLPSHLPEIWQHEVETYLEEFFYDQPSKIADFRWSSLSQRRLRDWVEPST